MLEQEEPSQGDKQGQAQGTDGASSGADGHRTGLWAEGASPESQALATESVDVTLLGEGCAAVSQGRTVSSGVIRIVQWVPNPSPGSLCGSEAHMVGRRPCTQRQRLSAALRGPG